MPRKQRFKPSRKPKPTNEEVGTSTIDQHTHANSGERMDPRPGRERHEIHPDDVDRVNGTDSDRSG